MNPGARKLVIGHLYPSLMNLYGDRGNVLCLEQRCRWRGIDVEIRELGLGDTLDPAEYDLLFIGGGQDREQKAAAEDLSQVKGPAIREYTESGGVTLAVCGGYQLFGHYYRPAEGPDLLGLGILDVTTVHKGPEAPRCIGNIIIEWEGETLVGFENHGGRTYLGPSAQPLGKVVIGSGNNAEDGSEGCVYKNTYGTYLHGSLLPKNPRFADHLLRLALERRYGAADLAPLADALERRAHQAALIRAKQSR